jgi:hypothetical protein
MKTYTKTTTKEEPRLVIEHDENAESPREWTNLGYFITQDRNYHSPDKNEALQAIIKIAGDNATSQAEHMAMIKKAYQTGDKILAIYPIVKYEHSGVSYSLGTTHGFDYSNNGFYIITEKTQKEVGTKKKDWEKVIRQELEVYNQWCSGEVYRFTLFDKDGEVEDSCGGFYDIEDIRGHLPAEWKNEDLTAYMQ